MSNNKVKMWVCEISLYIVSKRMTLTVKKKMDRD